MLVAVFCLPITLLDSLYNGWRYGAFLCKATPYLQGVSVCASVNFLAAIAVDRTQDDLANREDNRLLDMDVFLMHHDPLGSLL
ncbi:hypothetical protein DPMN_026384 [Dreissena polymorpha]|uniref:G-protein coupled receptors family 1 profile domain-containing protein n=1 Tax=Dreissena polymorpha TaxID=45954 RepID=A0A9D4RCP3_DREPO|nr:hypothetical protein DPMN_026384 [Dreissena polymorpha]